ncbi:MAG: dihydrolipoamide acetyltransferase family protein [Xanthobacteraceae bacterium]
MSAFNLPDLGEGLQEAEIVSWHVAEGDHVVVDQPLVSVETEKAVVEVPSPRAGHILKLFAKVGERVKVGAPLLTFEEGPHAETGTVVGELAKPSIAPPKHEAQAGLPSGSILASPAVRIYARDRGIDLSQVRATGPAGTVTRADVDTASTASPGTPLRGARHSMAINMARAWREVVHATLYDDADISAWHVHRDITPRLIRALIAGCVAERSLNASFDAASMSLHPNESIDLGLAVDSPDGLFVPVLRNVAHETPDSLRRRLDDAKTGVAQRSLAPSQLRGATITLSNFGTIAGRHAALIIMPPQVAIIGAGRIEDHAVNSPAHRSLPLSLTFDHRAVTGGEAACFLRAMIANLELPQ